MAIFDHQTDGDWTMTEPAKVADGEASGAEAKCL
jgi:hypothetical protein